MTPLSAAISRHSLEKPADIAIEDGAGSAVTWQTLAQLLPAVTADIRRAFDVSRPVAVRTDHSVGRCLLDLALIEAGIPTVAIPAFFTAEQTASALDAAGCPALITAATPMPSGSPGLEIDAQHTSRPAAMLPAGTAVISFTSGSTGTPRGICLSIDHLCGVAGAVVSYLGVEHAGRHLALLPPGILLEDVAGFYATMLAGGTYMAVAQASVGLADPFRPDFIRLSRTIEALAASSLILVPEYLAGLVTAMEATSLRLPRLTLVAVGGARIEPALLDRAAALGLPVRQGYGLTECGSVVALERGDETRRGSVGSSIGVNRITVAEDGEIVIDGPAFLGMIGAPRDPGPLYTGDIGRVDEDGRLWIEGRKSSLIVTSFGRNISPEWIEGALVAQPAILQAMVRGDGKAALDALIVPASPHADIDAALSAVNAALPPYARVAHWQVVPPFTPSGGLLTGNGRLKRAAIARHYPAPSAGMPFFDRLVAETREAQARFAMVPQLQAGLTGRISRADYIAYLAQAFHHVRHTVPLMEEARARLEARPMLVEALDEYIAEETGHEFWILDDIDAAGGSGSVVAMTAPAPATAAMVEHAYRTIREGNPAAFFGMVYVLEGTSIAMASSGADAVRKTLGLPPEAFRYLTSHGVLDQDHMQFFERLMNRIDDPDDQAAIIRMANEMFALFGAMFAGIELENVRAAA